MILLGMIFISIVGEFALLKLLPSTAQQTPARSGDSLTGTTLLAFCWTFIIMVPLSLYLNVDIGLGFIGMYLWNMIVFGMLTYSKTMNVVDATLTKCQLVKLFQVVCTYIIIKYILVVT